MGLATVLFIIANLVIMGGYLFVAARIAPRFKLKYLYTRVGGIFFFLLCGLTHGSMAYYAWTGDHHDWTSWWSLLIHITQAIAVWMFVLGIYREFIVENRTARAKD
jgi:uncharacterized membrane-anchored protein